MVRSSSCLTNSFLWLVFHNWVKQQKLGRLRSYSPWLTHLRCDEEVVAAIALGVDVFVEHHAYLPLIANCTGVISCENWLWPRERESLTLGSAIDVTIAKLNSLLQYRCKWSDGS